MRMVNADYYLYDEVRLNRKKEPGVELVTNLPYLPTGEGNIAYKAAKLLQDEFAIKEGVRISLKKHIPVAAGLAGGSSNAAAVLFGMNRSSDWTEHGRADGAGGKAGSGCAVLYYAGNRPGRRDRRAAERSSFYAEMYGAYCQAAGQRVHPNGL